ncbi:osm1 [Symbiodinium sp. CCMP2456]|nr:osm1 [Symbiodinium sp. CCMP2456]
MLPGDVQSRTWSSDTLVSGLAAITAQAHPELCKLLGCNETDPEMKAMQDELAQLEAGSVYGAEALLSPSNQREYGAQETQTIPDTPDPVDMEMEPPAPDVTAQKKTKDPADVRGKGKGQGLATPSTVARNLSDAFANAEDAQDVPRNTEQWKDFARHRELAGMAVPPHESLQQCGPERPVAEPAVVREIEMEDLQEEFVIQDPQPPPQLVEISENAIYKRMYRVFKMREDGSYLVPEDLVQEWKNKSTRANVVKIFEKCGYNPEKFVRKVQKVTEEGDEVEVDEDWEFMTEEEMTDKGWSEERINGVKAHCQKNKDKGYIRKSLYDDEVLYWCNTKIKGKKRSYKKSFVRKVLEYDEEAENDTNRLDCDFDFGGGSDGPAGSQDTKQPPAEIVDPKLLSCFPDIERASNPCLIYSKAGLAVEKRINKLNEFKDELAKRIETDLTEKMATKICSFVSKLTEDDAELTRLYNSGIIDGYSSELLC